MADLTLGDEEAGAGFGKALAHAKPVTAGRLESDDRRRFVEARPHPFEQVGERPFADGDADDVAEQGREALEADRWQKCRD